MANAARRNAPPIIIDGSSTVAAGRTAAHGVLRLLEAWLEIRTRHSRAIAERRIERAAAPTETQVRGAKDAPWWRSWRARTRRR